MNRKKYFIFYFLVLLLLNTLPVNNSSSQLNHTYVFEVRGDFWLHAIIFSPWASFNILSGNCEKRINWFIIGICCACSMEGLQYILPYRTFNLIDLLSNIIGIAIGNLGYYVYEKKIIHE